MDEETKNMLTAWNLMNYIEVFALNHITIDCLNLLDTQMIKELIPPIGDRVIFLKNLENWKTLTGNDIDLGNSTHASNSTFTYEIEDIQKDLVILKSLPGSSKQSQDCSDNVVYVDKLSEKHKNYREPLLDVENLPVCENVINETSTPLSTRTSSPVKPNINDADDRFSSKKKTLLDILKFNPEGNILLKLYKKEGLLNSSARRKLCNIIIKELLGDQPNEAKVTNEMLFHMACQIKEIFEKENISTYFIPYVHNKKLKIKRCAKGKLYDCLHNRRREYRTAEKKIINVSLDDTTVTEIEIIAGVTPQYTENIDKDLEWLRNSSDPWRIVEEKWKITSKFRLAESKNKSIAAYVNEYPALKKPTGYQLLLIDFETLYPNKSELLYENFAAYRNKIIGLALKKQNRNVDNPINKLLVEYEVLKEKSDNTREEGSNIVALMMLPLLIGHSLLKSKKSGWRPSKQESMDGFITHVVHEMDIQETITKRKEKFTKIGVTFQPTIFILGSSISNIKQYFIILNNTFYTVHSILQAVDVCFKLYQALNCTYPIECENVWNLIQKGFYNIETEWDKQFTSVNAFLTDLGITV